MRVVVAPDSFKGSLTSVEVATALAEGWRAIRPDDELVLAPLADGGEGTLVAIATAGGWEWRTTAAVDPIGRPVAARWLRSADGRRAVVELAEASGLSRLATVERDPVRASTLGTGQVIRAVLDEGIRTITLGIGGSATTDGGAGILRALGAVIDEPGAGGPGGGADAGGGANAGGDEPGAGGDEPGAGGDEPRAGGAAGAAGTGTVDLGGLDLRLGEVRLRIACDVSNPLLGPTGAASTYGPQKGASPAQVDALEAALLRFADGLRLATGRDERETPGAGAAGGTAFGLLSIADRFGSVRLVPGVEVVVEETGLREKLTGADLVITGEGRIDAQTAFGKTALGVAKLAKGAGVRCIAVGGGVTPEGEAVLAAVGATAVPVHERPIAVEVAMAAGAGPVVACGERMARGVRMLAPR